MMENNYLSTFIDYSFFRVFGGASGEPLLIDFLNSVLPPESQIKKLRYENPVQSSKLGRYSTHTMDVYCENQNGEEFTIEMLNAWADFYGHRANFYTYFPAWRQAEKNDLPDFPSQKIYCIGILDFAFDLFEEEYRWDEYRHVIKRKDEDGRVVNPKLSCIYLEVPNFMKPETELVSRLDKWLYFIKHLEDFQHIPPIFENDEIFKQAFEKADTSKYTHGEWNDRRWWMDYYWCRSAELGPAIAEVKGRARTEERAIAARIEYNEAYEEGRKIGYAQVGLENGYSLPDIARDLDISVQDLSDLLSDYDKRDKDNWADAKRA